MARFLLITYALERALMKLGLLDSEEFNRYRVDRSVIDHRYRVDKSVKALKAVLPSVQALLQDTEERVLPSWLPRAFLDIQEHVDWIEYSLDGRAIPGDLTVRKLESVLVVLNRISLSLEEIRSNRQQVESPGLGVISDDVKTVGRGDDVLKIVEFLKGSTNHQLLYVFPIVGMAGLGKTALARLVREKVSERQLFDETVWISVSDNFEELTVLREMLTDLGEHMAGGTGSKGETLEHLSKVLQGKQFLLVLDDVWNEDVEKWDRLKDCLLKVGGSNGSAVLVTTRSGQAASIMETFPGCRHDLKRLSDGDCWSIIREKVSGNEGEPLPLDLEVIGKEIASKCGGVPLVAHFLGETMCSGKERGQWLSVKNRCLRDIPGYEDIIIPTLLKSFYHLPSPALKLCFAYCSILSQDFTVEKEQLIQLWMAEGFLVQSNDQRMEDTGDVFFNKFVDSSFVEVVEWDERGKIRSCKMNRLMHDLALHVSKFRTLNLDFHHMRTLNLDGADIKELIDSIGDLECLRFLDLSRTCIKALPKSITNLHNMQTLRLIECASLESLPRDMRDASQGGVLDFSSNCILIVGKDSDSTIEELESLNGLRGQLSIYNLQEVNNKTEAEKANLRGKTKIYKLEFVWRSGRKCFKNDEEVLEALQPHSNLETLKIEHYGGEKLPSWLLMKSPTHGGSSLVNCLVNLKLIDCKRCELPMLGHLPRLKSLEIDGLDKVRTINMKFYRSTGFSETMAVFPALKKLSLRRMVNLVEWMVPAVSEGQSAMFPFLKELSIMSCPLLASISLKNAPSLALLKICFCDELKSLSMDSSASTALEDLTIKCCPNLESIPSAECLKSLKSLEIDGLDKVRTGFSETMAVFPALKKLSLHRMVNLDEWMVPAVREDHSAVFPFLEELSIISCTLLASISDECQNEGCHKSNSPLTTSLQIFNSLQYLRLEDFPGLFYIPDLKNLSLKGLTIKHCPDLECIDSLQNLTTLEVLRIEVCPYLKSIPSVGDLSSLKTLSIQRCHKLTSLPTELQSCVSLKNLSIQWCIELTSIPDKLKELHSLVQLEITKCPSLTYFPEDSLYSLTQLKQLTIGPFSEKLEVFPGLNSIQPFLAPLEEVQIHGWNRLKSLPDQLKQLTVLKSLHIGRFNKVEELPEWLGDLKSLQRLRIWRCQNLRYLPTSMKSLFMLKRLEIIDCHREWP
uniref:Uncharacterized protein n=1 Tax=Salix viminalis TaxID=40686 RepID=A0A6N2L501_SALVM